jgi:hypothetical protein
MAKLKTHEAALALEGYTHGMAHLDLIIQSKTSVSQKQGTESSLQFP